MESLATTDDSSRFKVWARGKLIELLWIFVGATGYLIIPVVKLVSAIALIFFISVILYLRLRSSILPKTFLTEPVYFDFASAHPIARISLLTEERQWHYTKDCTRIRSEELNQNTDVQQSEKDSSVGHETDLKAFCGRRTRPRLLRSGHKHFFTMTFVLSKSRTNLLRGKFMLRTTLFDTKGEAIAQSSRPVVIPYQSDVSLFIESVCKYPLRAFGLVDTTETAAVQVTIMNDYLEPTHVNAATEYLELVLSTADVDIFESHISIMPALSGIIYYMYFYPRLSFAFGVAFFTGLQIGTLTFVFTARTVWSVMFAKEPKEAEEIEEGGGGSEQAPSSSSHTSSASARERERARRPVGRQRGFSYIRSSFSSSSSGLASSRSHIGSHVGSVSVNGSRESESGRERESVGSTSTRSVAASQEGSSTSTSSEAAPSSSSSPAEPSPPTVFPPELRRRTMWRRGFS